MTSKSDRPARDEDIIAMHKAGATQTSIAAKHRITQSYVCQIIGKWRVRAQAEALREAWERDQPSYKPELIGPPASHIRDDDDYHADAEWDGLGG